MDVIGSGYWAPPPGSPRGSQSVDLSGDAPGSLTQTVKTAPGSSYLLKWYAAGNPDCGQSPKVMHVVWGNKLVAKLIASPAMSTKGRTRSKMVWSLKSQVVVASSALSVLVSRTPRPTRAPVAPSSLTSR